jgi:hypothetical protein
MPNPVLWFQETIAHLEAVTGQGIDEIASVLHVDAQRLKLARNGSATSLTDDDVARFTEGLTALMEGEDLDAEDAVRRGYQRPETIRSLYLEHMDK